MGRWIADDEWNDRYVTTHDVKVPLPDALQLLLLDVRHLPAHRFGDEPAFLFRNDDDPST